MCPKTSLAHFYYADMRGHYAVFDVFYHALHNSLNINEFNILHLENDFVWESVYL